MNDYWRKVFSWSHSRQRIWDTCRLAYFFRYVDRWEYPKGHPLRKNLEHLNGLINLNALQGSLVHGVLETQINHHRLGRNLDRSAAESQYLTQLAAIERAPRNHIVEAANDGDIRPGFFEEVRTQGPQLIHNFFDIFWPVYRSLEYLEHEEFERFSIPEGPEVVVKVDLVTRADDIIVVTDWKTGAVPTGNHKDQMATYALWAVEKYGVSPDNVKAEAVYLAACTQQVYEPVTADLHQLQQTITMHSTEMLQVETRQDFPPDPAPWKCSRCHFLTVCEWGKKTVKSPGNSD